MIQKRILGSNKKQVRFLIYVSVGLINPLILAFYNIREMKYNIKKTESTSVKSFSVNRWFQVLFLSIVGELVGIPLARLVAF